MAIIMNLPLNIDFQQILLHLFNFVILAAGLYFLLYSPIKKFMDKRTAAYAKREQEADEKLKSAEDTQKQYLEKLSQAETEAETIRQDAEKSAAEVKEQAVGKAKEEAEKLLAHAQKEALLEKTKVMESARREIAGMVVEATEKLVCENESVEHDKALYDQFLASAKEGKQP